MKRFLHILSIITSVLSLSSIARAQTITAGAVTGKISAYVGTTSAAPLIQQFTVSGGGLSADITATAPTGFEVSLAAGSGYGSSVTLAQTGGLVNNAIIYVRSSASATAGNITGNVSLTSPGATSQNVAVAGTVNVLPTVDAVPSQTVNGGSPTKAVNFTGAGNAFTWTNDTPAIGLAATGTGDIASFTAINTGSSPVTATITVTPAKAAYAYIANAGSANVSVINTVTNTVVGSPIALTPTAKPFGLAISRDGSKLYVIDRGVNQLLVVNIATRAIIATIATGPFPFALAISPDGNRVYVTNTYLNTVSVINTTTNTLTADIPVGTNPTGVVVSPDGSTVYVANDVSGNVSVINTAVNAVIKTIKVGSQSISLAISADGSKLYVVNNYSESVSVINTGSGTVVATIPVGFVPAGVAVSPDGSRLYVANSSNRGNGTVLVINALTNTVIATIPTGIDPYGVSVTPDGAEVYVADPGTNNVYVLNVATNAIVTVIPVGSNPFSLDYFMSAGSPFGAPFIFTITVNPESFPTITATGNPSPLTTIYGTPSSSTTFTVSGSNLTAGILVTPPAGFEVSTDGITYTPAITVTGTGTIASTTVYIRLTSSTPVGNNYSGNIALSSAGATNVNVEMPVSTVTPAPLTITADDKSKALGEANPVLTVTYSGFVNNDGPAQLTTQPVITTTALTTSPAGQYTVTAAGAADPNYTITYVPGILTINPQPQTITVPNAFTPNGDGVNDTWDIKYLNTFPNCTVAVFNRWGQNVYSSNGYGISWDGSYKGTILPTGTYYYLINLRNGLNVLSGYVAIIR